MQGILECKRYLGHCFTELTVDSASQHERACRILPGGGNKILGLQRSNRQITANPHAIKEGRNLLFVLNFKNMQIKPSKKGQVPPPLLISADAHLTRVVFIILPPMGFSSYLFAFFFPLLYLRLYYCAAYVLPSAAVLCIGSCNRWPVLEHCSALQCACAVFGNERKGV